MSLELSNGPFTYTPYHTMGLAFRKLREQHRVTIIKALAEDLHNAGLSVSKTYFQSMIKDRDLDDYYYDDEFTVEFSNLINNIHGLGTNCISTARLRLPNYVVEDTGDRDDMAILEITYKVAKPPKVDKSHRWDGNRYTTEPGVYAGGFEGGGDSVNYVSVSEFAQDYMSRFEGWKAFKTKHSEKLAKVEAEVKALKKAEKTKK